MSATLTAFGKTYATPAAATDRLAELAAANATYGPSDDRVTEADALMTALARWGAEARAEAAAAAKPYVVYTRLYRESGFCEKRVHRFATRKAMESFMDRTPRAVTFHTR